MKWFLFLIFILALVSVSKARSHSRINENTNMIYFAVPTSYGINPNGSHFPYANAHAYLIEHNVSIAQGDIYADGATRSPGEIWSKQRQFNLWYGLVVWPTYDGPVTFQPFEQPLAAVKNPTRPPPVFIETVVYWSDSVIEILPVDINEDGTPDNADNSTNEPIDTKNGNNYFLEKRISVPCPGIPLEVNLRYQSLADLPTGILGEGWRHSLEWNLDVQTNKAVLYTGSGKKKVFDADGSGGYLSPKSNNWKLEEVTAGYELGLPGGRTYAFDTNGVLISAYDAWRNGVECSYGTNGCLERAIHSNGRELVFSNEWHGISGEWRMASVYVSGGPSLLFSYNGDGQFTQVVEQIGTTTCTSHYQYAQGFLTNKVNGAGFSYSYDYEQNSGGVLNGKGTHLDMDGYYEHEVEYATPVTTDVFYSLRGIEQVCRYSRNAGQMLDTKHGPGRSISEAMTRGVNYSYATNNEDKVEETLFDNATGATWSEWMLYDDAHNITNYAVSYGTTNPVHQFSLEYDSVWQLPSVVTDAEGHRVETLYTNGSPQVVKAFHSASNSHDTHFAYTTNGLVKAITNPNGHVTSFGYDGAGNLVSVAAELGPIVTNTYDALGFVQSVEVLSESGASTGRIMQYVTDAKGRILKITYPDDLEESFDYNALGYLTNTVDRAGRKTEFAYVPTKKLTSVMRYLNEGGSNIPVRIGCDLDKQMNLLRISEPRRRYVESYQLDIQDRVTAVTNIENQVMSIDYSIGDFVSQVTRFDGSTISNAYDTAGRLGSAVYGRDGSPQSSASVSYTYWPDNELKTISDGFSAITNTYDALNHLVAVTSSVPSVSSVVNTYQHDPVGNLTNSVVSIGNQQSAIGHAYTYDAAERLTDIFSHEGTETQRFVYSYSPENGRVASVSNTVSGITGAYEYDLMGRVTNITYRAGDGSLIRSLAYEYDAAGMIGQKTITGGGTTSVSSYVYDSLDRLVSESQSGSVSSVVYNYDLAGTYTLGSGNRLVAASTAATNTLFVSGTANEPIGTDNRWGELWITNFTSGVSVIPSVNGNSFFATIPALAEQTNTVKAAIRDEAGNMGYVTGDFWVGTNGGMTSVSSYDYDAAGCLTNLNGVVSLEWDERYRLKAVSSQQSAVSYTYDVLGRRVSCTVAEGQDLGTTNVVHYVYDGNQVVADLDENGDLLRTYVWGGGIDNLLSMTIYTNGGAQASATYYAIKDHLNSVIALVDDTGSVVESYDYDAYGNTKVFDGSGVELSESAIGNRYCFQGREVDWATGLIYFRARWYDPETGRWLSKDPIGIAGGLNQYVFVDNSPVNFVDPSGLLVQIHSRDVNGTGGLGAHTYVTVTDSTGTVNTWGSYNINGRNKARHNHPSDVGTPRTSSITVPPPAGMTQAQWDAAVNQAGRNRVQTQNQKYDLWGGRSSGEGNCHKTTRGILNDAGGRVPSRYNPPGLNPSLHP
jgi:RHS repeat-associated protein